MKSNIKYVLYIFVTPEMESSHYALKRAENREKIDELLAEVEAAYENNRTDG